jgi:hypothetical protein
VCPICHHTNGLTWGQAKIEGGGNELKEIEVKIKELVGWFSFQPHKGSGIVTKIA